MKFKTVVLFSLLFCVSFSVFGFESTESNVDKMENFDVVDYPTDLSLCSGVSGNLFVADYLEIYAAVTEYNEKVESSNNKPEIVPTSNSPNIKGNQKAIPKPFIMYLHTYGLSSC